MKGVHDHRFIIKGTRDSKMKWVVFSEIGHSAIVGIGDDRSQEEEDFQVHYVQDPVGLPSVICLPRCLGMRPRMPSQFLRKEK